MIQQQFQELIICSRDPWHFLLTYVKTQDPAHGTLAYPDFPYLNELIHDALRERYLLVPKSRQMLVTWSMLSLFLWRALFRQSGVYLLLSRNERCAEELLERVRFILSNLPKYMQPQLGTNNKSELEFKGIARAYFRFRHHPTAHACIPQPQSSGMKWPSPHSTNKSGQP